MSKKIEFNFSSWSIHFHPKEKLPYRVCIHYVGDVDLQAIMDTDRKEFKTIEEALTWIDSAEEIYGTA